MKKIILMITMAVAFSFVQSCSDCPLSQQDPVYLCKTNIVTIQRFNPHFTLTYDAPTDKYISTLDSDYCISMFEFPMSSGSTGSFPNDSRYEGNMQLPIASQSFTSNGTAYNANIMDEFPSNDQLAGDIMLREIDLSGASNTALIRVAGIISRINQNFLTENSEVFCDYVQDNSTVISKAFTDMTDDNKYGQGLPFALRSNYTSSNIIVTDMSNKIIGTAGQAGVPTPGNDIISSLRAAANQKSSIDLRVNQGDMFVYIAKNGKRFVFFVSEIRQSSVNPFRKQVSIMLNPLD